MRNSKQIFTWWCSLHIVYQHSVLLTLAGLLTLLCLMLPIIRSMQMSAHLMLNVTHSTFLKPQFKCVAVSLWFNFTESWPGLWKSVRHYSDFFQPEIFLTLKMCSSLDQEGKGLGGEILSVSSDGFPSDTWMFLKKTLNESRSWKF